jgi:hypothetical protein
MLPEVTVTAEGDAYWTPISESTEEWESLSLDEKLERYDDWYSNPNNTTNVAGTDEFNSTREDLINDHYDAVENKQNARVEGGITYDGSGGTGKTPGGVAADQTEADRVEMNLGDKIDLALSVGGMTPVYGVLADGFNVAQNLVQVGYNLVTMDWDEAVHDFKNAAWALAGMIPIFGGGFTSLKYGKTLGKMAKSDDAYRASDDFMEFMTKASDQEIMAAKFLTGTEKNQIMHARYNFILSQSAAAGDVVRGRRYYNGAVHFGVMKSSDEIYETIHGSGGLIEGIKVYGESVDLANRGFNAMTDLKPEMIKQVGYTGQRAIYEVTYPSGHTQRFWRSSGWGGKSVRVPDGKGGFKQVSSEGYFGTLPGHLDYNLSGAELHKHVKKLGYVNDASRPPIFNNLDKFGNPVFKNAAEEYASQIGFYSSTNGWFVKHGDWQGYGSQQFQNTGAKLKEMFDAGELKVVKDPNAFLPAKTGTTTTGKYDMQTTQRID